MEKIKNIHHHIKKHSQVLITKWGTLPVIVLLLVLPIAVVASVNEQTTEQHAATSTAPEGTIKCGNTSTARCFKNQCGNGYTSNGNGPGPGGVCGSNYGSVGICCDVISGNSKVYGSCAGINDTNKAICTGDTCGKGVAQNYPNKLTSSACSQNCCAIKSISNNSSSSSSSSSSSKSSSSSSSANSSSSSKSSSTSSSNSSSSSSSSSSKSSTSSSSSSSQNPFPSYVCAGSGVGTGCPSIAPTSGNSQSSGSSSSSASSGSTGSQISSGGNSSQASSSSSSSSSSDGNLSNGDIFSLIQKLLQLLEQLINALSGSGSSHHSHHHRD